MSDKVKVALIGACATILAAVITGLFVLHGPPPNGGVNPPPGSLTVSPNSTVTTAQAQASATAQAQANATATATAHQNRYTQATSGTPTFADPLTDNNRGYGWNVSSGYCTFIGGALHAKRPSPGALDCDATGASSFSNFAFQAQMTIMSGDAGGIDFRINPANNYAGYYFSIGRDGSYRFYRSANFSLQLVASGTSSAVSTGLGQTNLITVIAQGGTFDLYVNAQYITTVTDNTYSQGVIGVFAEDQRNSTEVIFNNVKVWTL